LRNTLARAILVTCLGVTSALAQTASRVATTADLLLAYPVFFHGKQIVIRSAVESVGSLTRLTTAQAVDTAGKKPASIYVLWKERPSRADGEIRGEFWDLGRLREDDGRFTSYDFKPLLETTTGGRWPGRDEVYVVLGATMIDSPLPMSASLRAIALAPERYVDRGVTVVGRFRGRNLYGDLPTPLNRSRWDFVIQSADGAVWVSNLRPKGKNFELDAGARVDTGKWLEVTGVVKKEGHNVWIEGESLQLATAPSDTPVDIVVTPVVKEAPPQVIFSAPVADESDVAPTVTVRVQFSRDMDPRSFRDRVRISYPSPPQGAPARAAPIANVTYREGNRALEIKFAKPLERFMPVKVELIEGVAAVDGQPLPPWTLTFTTGG
jgi:hypothetical protein